MAESLNASSRFKELDGNRTTVRDRAVLCSEMTLPYLVRETSATENDDLSREYVQGFGAKLVNHLVGKFALSILPPEQPFFTLSPTQEALESVTQGDVAMSQEAMKILAQKEDSVMRYIRKSRFRKSLFKALRLACVTGQAIIEKYEDSKYRVFNLNGFVVERDALGTIVTLIIREKIDARTLPEEVNYDLQNDGEMEEIEIYTIAQLLEDGTYQIQQEIEDEVVNDIGIIKEFNDRFISVEWNLLDDEDYPRSFVEEYLGTFLSLNKQLKVLNESAVASSKIVHTVNPNGLTKYKDFVDAKNGDAIPGKEDDIGTIRANKNYDMQTTYQLVQDYKKELAEAFLMGSSSVRNAERVTAHEIRLMAQELEASFGGVYTNIAEEIQIPLVEEGLKSIKLDTGDDIDVIITSGIEALGRNVELTKINNMMSELQMLGSIVGMEAIARTVNVNSVATAIISNSGVAGKNFIYSQQEQDSMVANEKQEMIAQQALTQNMNQGM